MPWFFPSFLTPTFLVLGLVALSLPILFHFFRRTPKGNVQFSTLMFLQPSPPRLTRRSRVDNWLLLILRGLILLFIALAFGRIFFRQSDILNIADLPSRRIAVLVDTSASMFRGDLWEQAKSEYQEVINGLGPNDEVAVFSFDSELQSLIGFTSTDSKKVANRELIKNLLDGVGPTWRQTDLGLALVETCERLESDLDTDSKDQIAESQIVLISDFQSGSQLKSLQSFEWPEEILVELKRVESKSPSNATPSLLIDKQGLPGNSKIRIKVTNVAGSTKSEFDLHWLNQDAEATELAGTIVVPPGQSRVIQVQPPTGSFTGIELSGDDEAFDNRHFLAFPEQIPEKILFLGAEEDVRNQLLFYLEKACSNSASQRFAFFNQPALSEPDSNAISSYDIVFVVGDLDTEQAQQVKKFAEEGGLICIVVTGESMQDTVNTLVDDSLTIKESTGVDYALLAEIDFRHKMFAPFSDPKFSNFSNIQFWKHRIISSDQLKTIASFDTGAPAISSRAIGSGQCVLFASGWHPADSQFALSTKFVGVMMSMMLKKLTAENRNLLLGEPVNLTEFTDGKDATLETPGGDTVELKPVDRPEFISEIDVPGIYQLSSPTQTSPLAFNLPLSESQTDVLDQELLEQEQVRLGTMATATEKVEKERQRRDKELENRQKLWRWMLIAALAVLFVETFLAGRFAQRQVQNDLAERES